MPEFPDYYLPPVTSSLFHFVQEGYSLLEENDEPSASHFMQLMLAGMRDLAHRNGPEDSSISPPPDNYCRVFINPRQGLDPPVNPTIVGDFDSVIGLTRRLPFAKAISWHIIPLFKETLGKNAHLFRNIRVEVIISPVVTTPLLICLVRTR